MEIVLQSGALPSVKRYHHCDVIRNSGTIRKILEPQLEFTAEELADLADQIRTYHAQLSEVGVPVPQPHTVTIEDGHVVLTCADKGPSVHRLLKDAPHDAEAALGGILFRLLPILRGEHPEIGIDPHFGNWCTRNGFDDLVFVDFHPARIVWHGTWLLGFPQPTDSALASHLASYYYTPVGICRKLISIFARYAPMAVYDRFMATLYSFDRGVADWIADDMEEIGIFTATTSFALRARLDATPDGNATDLLELAIQLVSYGLAPRALVDDMQRLTFRLSSYPHEERAARFAMARHRLMLVLSS